MSSRRWIVSRQLAFGCFCFEMGSEISVTIESHSRYNLLHGCSLVVYFVKQGLLKPSIENFSALSPLEKLTHLLQQLEKQYPEFWLLDHPTYALDDKTKDFLATEGLDTFRKLKIDLANYSSTELLGFLEKEFKRAF